MQLYHVSLKVIMYNSQQDMLVLSLPATSSMHGWYDLPGGRIDSEEAGLPLTDVIAREMAEELGEDVSYTLRSPCPVATAQHSYVSRQTGDTGWILQLYFEADYVGGEICISDEHAGYEWKKITAKNYQRFFTRGFLKGMGQYFATVKV